MTQLYTNISNTAGLHAAKEAYGGFKTNPKVKLSNGSLVQFLEFVLTKNNFHFNGDHYLQVSGMSIGTKMTPAYANLFVGQFKEDLIYTYHTPPTVW